MGLRFVKINYSFYYIWGALSSKIHLFDNFMTCCERQPRVNNQHNSLTLGKCCSLAKEMARGFLYWISKQLRSLTIRMRILDWEASYSLRQVMEFSSSIAEVANIFLLYLGSGEKYKHKHQNKIIYCNWENKCLLEEY